MEYNTDFNSLKFHQKMHYMNSLLKYDTHPIASQNDNMTNYLISPKNIYMPDFDVIYNATTGIMRIVSLNSNVRCKFHFRKVYLNNQTNAISLADIIDEIIEVTIEVNEDITITYLEDFDSHFSEENLLKNKNVLDVFLDIRYAASQIQFLN